MKTRTSIAVLTAAMAATAEAAPSALGGAAIEWQSVAMYALIAVCALALFCFLCKLIRLLMAVAIIAALAAAGVFYCVKAGYLDESTAERLNPMNSEAFTDSMRRAGEWVGDKARSTVEKALSTAAERAVAREAPPLPPAPSPDEP